MFGEFFQFMEAVLSTVVCNEILMDLYDVSMLLWKNGVVWRRTITHCRNGGHSRLLQRGD